MTPNLLVQTRTNEIRQSNYSGLAKPNNPNSVIRTWQSRWAIYGLYLHYTNNKNHNFFCLLYALRAHIHIIPHRTLTQH
ncbi:hypothetical protein Hanom_Chr08g00732791 [Helianthus anomalus]